MPAEDCLICGTRAVREQGTGDWTRVQCRRCGSFRITGDFELGWNDSAGSLTDVTRGTASGWIQEGVDRLLQLEDLARLQALTPLPVGEKAERLLKFLAKKSPRPGDQLTVQCDDSHVLGLTWASNLMEVKYLAADYLADAKGYLQLSGPRHLSNSSLGGISIAPAGWAFLESLRYSNAESARGFIAMYFADHLTELRETGLKGAITDAGYEARVMTDIEHANRIDDEIIAQIRGARFMVADFTGTRGGVYFEAGFAVGLGIPVIWTCSQETLDDDNLHFDVEHYNFLTWREGVIDEFRHRLSRRIESILGKGPRATSA